jgi:2-keto-4-pentenoate hydratase/2-oxohepta-3-ene-1,7-dioic acid hydratase in catechol pathway
MSRWCRYRKDGSTGFGLVEGDHVIPHAGSMFGQAQRAGDALPLSAVQLLAPCEPSAFVGLWNNFRASAAKNGWSEPAEPLYFLKAASSLAGPGEVIEPPPLPDVRVFYEGELGIVIGRRCHRADAAAARAAVFGYTCVNDVTAFDLLQRDASFAQWTRAKSFPTFGVIGPWIDTGFDPAVASVLTRINGRERQNYPVADMFFDPLRIVQLISHDMALNPGDVIACGTSIGAMPMKPGTRVEVEVTGLGILANTYGRAEGA